MVAATRAVQRAQDSKLLVIDSEANISHRPRAAFVELLRAGDVVVANDAATLPASLQGTHLRTGSAVEARLAGRTSLAPEDITTFLAILFGAGDFRTRTEDRAAPPIFAPGDRLAFGDLSATVERLAGHPRLVSLRFDGSPDEIWSRLARRGRPIQYAHVPDPLALGDVWAPISGVPAAFEPPSAGFVLDWRSLAAMRDRGAAFATLTHAAGVSSTGDVELDRRLPFDERYRIPEQTVGAIGRAKASGGRVIAIGTTVVRALEHAAGSGGLQPGDGLATQRIGVGFELLLVDAVLSGTHEPGTSHYELLRAFTSDAVLRQASEELEARGYKTHEFGDSVFIERALTSSLALR